MENVVVWCIMWRLTNDSKLRGQYIENIWSGNIYVKINIRKYDNNQLMNFIINTWWSPHDIIQQYCNYLVLVIGIKIEILFIYNPHYVFP